LTPLSLWTLMAAVRSPLPPSAAAVPTVTPAGQSTITWISDPRIIIGFFSALGVGGIVLLILRRYFDRVDKRQVALPHLHFHLQRLEKRLTITYYFPGQDAAEEDYAALIADLRDATLLYAGLFYRERPAIESALGSCTTEGTYLSAQRTRALTIDSSREIKAAARRALLAIYKARDALKDLEALVWPPDSDNQGLWHGGDIIIRAQ
jgi:hypothetical protein